MALRAASGSTTPGTSTSARSATSTPVASGEVSRSGRSMPAEKITSMVSPGERQVDQVARAVTRQAAHPQLVQVGEQLLAGHPEFGRRLGVADPWVGLEIGHHVQQPHQAGRDVAHRQSTPLPVRVAARARCRAAIPDPAPRRRRRSRRSRGPAGPRADVHSTVRRRRGHRVLAHRPAAGRRSAVARPSATHTRACSPAGLDDRAVHDVTQVDALGPGDRTDSARPRVTPSPMRDTRKVRGALRSRSCPTTYQRPR